MAVSLNMRLSVILVIVAWTMILHQPGVEGISMVFYQSVKWNNWYRAYMKSHRRKIRKIETNLKRQSRKMRTKMKMKTRMKKKMNHFVSRPRVG